MQCPICGEEIVTKYDTSPKTCPKCIASFKACCHICSLEYSMCFTEKCPAMTYRKEKFGSDNKNESSD